MPSKKTRSSQEQPAPSQTTQSNSCSPRLLRYPGGKGRILPGFARFLTTSEGIKGRYIEPFLGGAAVFLHVRPRAALLADINQELIEFYCVIRDDPDNTWNAYCGMPVDKDGYYRVRAQDPALLDRPGLAARLLYLNRTCFKGMWRHNRKGQFNVGYGGQSRRWVVTQEALLEASRRLKNAEILRSDFEPIIEHASGDDFLFLDPPYRPGMRDLVNRHYAGEGFTFDDQLRLAAALRQASNRGVHWLLTNSAHAEITGLYHGFSISPLETCTGARPGQLTGGAASEVAITNARLSPAFPSHV